MNKQKTNKKNNLLKKNLILAVLVVIIAVVPLLFLKNAKFSGSDDQAKNEITKIDVNYKPWVSPVWQPPSSEIESLLFFITGCNWIRNCMLFFWILKGKIKSSWRQKSLISIDKLAYISKLKKVNPMEKFIFAYGYYNYMYIVK